MLVCDAGHLQVFYDRRLWKSRCDVLLPTTSFFEPWRADLRPLFRGVPCRHLAVVHYIALLVISCNFCYHVIVLVFFLSAATNVIFCYCFVFIVLSGCRVISLWYLFQPSRHLVILRLLMLLSSCSHFGSLRWHPF